jgi:hypothetical protein
MQPCALHRMLPMAVDGIDECRDCPMALRDR